MKITFLGTSGMQPTKERSQPSVHISYGNTKLLIDCGEGTQRQMNIAGLKVPKLDKVLITHLHGDHILGLGGLIYNLGANEYKGTLEIYGPKGIKEYYKHSLGVLGRIDVKIKEIKEGKVYEDDNYIVYCKKLKHKPTCYGFRFEEKVRRKMNLDYLKKIGLTQDPLLGVLQKGKDITWNGKKVKVKDATYLIEGKKIAFVSDTAYCKNAVALAKNVDLLVSECTFLDEKAKAKEYNHLDADDVAKLANEANASKVVLTHFSQRYKETDEIKNRVKKSFKKEVVCAKDFLELDLYNF